MCAILLYADDIKILFTATITHMIGRPLIKQTGLQRSFEILEQACELVPRLVTKFF